MLPRPSVTRLAQTIARIELELARDERSSVVAQRILTQLHRRLGKLVGPLGFDVLLGRALVLARRVHPTPVQAMGTPADKPEDPTEVAPERATLDDGALTIVSYFLELLVTLIGEDLAMHVIRDIWPTAHGEGTGKN